MRRSSIALAFPMISLFALVSANLGCDSGSDGGSAAGGSSGGSSGSPRAGTSGGGSSTAGGAGGGGSPSGGATGSAGSAGGDMGAGGAGMAGAGGAGGQGGNAMGGMGGGAGGEPGAMGGAGGAQGQGDAGADPTDAGNPAADTWENFALPYMVKYCASCHNDDNQGDAQRNYRMFAAVMNESEEIACGSAKSQEVRDTLNCGGGAPRARQFPVGNGPRPTDEERDRLVQWIQAGLPE